MKRYKGYRVIVIALLMFVAIGTINTYGQAKEWRINLAIEPLGLDLKVGVEYQLTDSFGIAADIGTSALIFEGDFMLSYDLTPVIYITRSIGSLPIRAEVTFGLTDGMVVFTNPVACMWNLGADIRMSMPLTESVLLGGELGAGYPLFYKENQMSAGSNYLLGMWPHVEIYGQYSIH